MRCFFNLVSDLQIIRDETGVEVLGLEEAYAEAIKAINQWHQKDSIADWDRWSLNVADAHGMILMSIPLGPAGSCKPS
jgi:hypothetical protein